MSLITISDEFLTVTLDTAGAVFHSIVKDGVEYLWQGSEKYWKFRDKNLFPYIGRMTEGCYLLGDRKYPMPLHGFAPGSEFSVSERSAASVTLTLTESEETLAMYPFSFRFDITYTLSGASITKRCKVTNTGSEEMFFGLGSHPGFNVPLNGEGAFEDWYFEFEEASSPVRIGFDPANYRLSDVNLPYALEDGKQLHLAHALFDDDAIVLQGMPKTVTLKSAASPRAVRVTYPGMNFLGLWHMPKTDAPYVCIEPWLSLPSHSAYMEDLSRQAYLQHLPAGEEYTNEILFELS